MSDDNNAPFEFTAADESRQFLVDELKKKQQRLSELTLESNPLERANVQLDIADIMIDMAEPGMPEAAWGLAKEAFLLYIEQEEWEDAVRATDVLYRTNLPAAVNALANGIWLSVTYPIDPELSIVMLNNLIDDTPANSDGAAVAAATAHYLADLRLEGEKRDSTMFLTSGLLGKVAERHSDVKDQGQMNMWMLKLELNDPAKFLPRMAQILEAIADDNWWYDRDELRAKLPVN